MNASMSKNCKRMPAQYRDHQRESDRWVNEGGALGVEDRHSRAKRIGKFDLRPKVASRLAKGRFSPTTRENRIRLDIRSYQFSCDSIFREFAQQRVDAALHRFSRRVGRVMLYVTDVNGCRGGIDKQVRLVVRLRPRGDVIVTMKNKNIWIAVAQAASRASHSVKRKLRRLWTLRVRRSKLRPRVPGLVPEVMTGVHESIDVFAS